MQTTSWEKDGVRRYTTEIVARTMKMLGGKGNEASGESPDNYSGSSPTGGDDDFPF